MQKDQYVLNTEGKWKEGPIEVWFAELEALTNTTMRGERPSPQIQYDPENSHQKEDSLLWEFVHHVYERSTEPCIHGMCEALFNLEHTDRVRWYS